MDGAKFAKMLSDKHLFELDRMEYKYSVSSVQEFTELLRQNFAQPLPLADFFQRRVVLSAQSGSNLHQRHEAASFCPCKQSDFWLAGYDRGDSCNLPNRKHPFFTQQHPAYPEWLCPAQ